MLTFNFFLFHSLSKILASYLSFPGRDLGVRGLDTSRRTGCNGAGNFRFLLGCLFTTFLVRLDVEGNKQKQIRC